MLVRAIWPSVIWFILISVYQASCVKKSSLTFVIDDTNSMTDDIDQVKRSVHHITDTLLNTKSSQIGEMVLVTFNDPGIKFWTKTSSRQIFNQKMKEVFVYNYGQNKDCPEKSMSGLMLALEQSLPDSFVYVFTDASATDYLKKEQVKKLCQEKQTQITFIITGSCRHEDYYWMYLDPIYERNGVAHQVYYDIAAACSGIAIDIPKEDVGKFLKTLDETKDQKTPIVAVTTKPNVYTDVPFVIDEHTEYAIITATGINVELSISPYGHQERILWIPNGKTIKLTDAVPGTYIARVKGQSSTQVVVVGRTDFVFTHGFSESKPNSLHDTTKTPDAGSTDYVGIEVTDPKNDVNIESADIVTMDGTVINHSPLTKVADNFYITKPIVVPLDMFKIVVKGTTKDSGKKINRITKIPITPKKSPVTITSDSSKIYEAVEGDVAMTIPCVVTGTPKPQVTWSRNNIPITPSKKYSIQDGALIIKLPKVSDTDSYTCEAKNQVAARRATFKTYILQSPRITKHQKRLQFRVGDSATLRIPCVVTGVPKPIITWKWNGLKLDPNRRHTIEDGALIITNPEVGDAGSYTCIAQNKVATVSAATIVQVSQTPKVEGVDSMKVLLGKPASIKCKVVEGVPKPNISWQFKASSSSQFESMAGTNYELNIESVTHKHTGQYKCVAKNDVGAAEHVTMFTVQELPRIVSDSFTVYMAKEGIDKVLKIPCLATGTPKPVITWRVNGLHIIPNSKFSIDDGVLTIDHPTVSDTNSYTCEARNEVAAVSSTFKVSVVQTPVITGDASKTVKVGESATMECKLSKGVPKPKISWHFATTSDSKFAALDGIDKVHSIANAEPHHAGQYKCIAENVAGRAEHTTQLIVEYPPSIVSESSTVIKGIEGDIAMRIPCKVVGYPQPQIIWKLNGTIIATNEHYSIKNGDLIIDKPKEKDGGKYTCEARNDLGDASATFQAEVDKTIEDFGTPHQVYIKKGESVKLECGSESQLVRWYLNPELYVKEGPYIHIKNADVYDDGNYTCRVSDKNGAHTETYFVDVGFPPVFKQPQVDTSINRAETTILRCYVNAKPLATVEWTLNGKVLTGQNDVELPIADWGTYTCNVSNIHGAVQRRYEVTSTGCMINTNSKDIPNMPLLLSETLSWPESWTINNNYLLLDPGNEVTFYCPNAKTSNSIRHFSRNAIKASCYKQDMYLVDNQRYKLSDFQCANAVEATIVRTKEKCATKTSELIRVGYSVNGFLEAYTICFDHASNMPLYTRVVVSGASAGSGEAYEWHTHPDVATKTDETVYTCKKSSSNCCYAKTQLVSSSEFIFGPAQNSTFIDPLNVIPYWRPCDNTLTDWQTIEERTKLLYSNFIAWSGTHTLQHKNGAVIPRYLWKVLSFDSGDESSTSEHIAIVHVNDASPSDEDVRCGREVTDFCSEKGFQDMTDSNTYCCNTEDFLKAFDLHTTKLGALVEADTTKASI